MADVIDELLAHPDVRRAAPASPELIEEVEEWYKVPLPPALVKLWSASDGLTLDTIYGDFVGPSEVLKFANLPVGGWMFERGFVPVLYDRQSDYLGLLIREPLAYRVVYLAHDDGIPVLRYRDPESYVRALLEAVQRGRSADELMAGSLGDYAPEASRPVEDQIAARELLATDGLHEEWYYAVQLFDETNFDAWEKLLEIPDPFVRVRVCARMSKMQSMEIQDLLAQDAQALDQFVRLVTDAARKAGLPVAQRDGSALQIGERWFYLETFFYRRGIPNAIPRLIAWLEDQAAGRNPTDRPGNFMAD